MENGLLLTFPHRSIISCSVFAPQLQFLQLKSSHFHFTSRHHHRNQLRFSFTVTTTKCSSKWDSNAKRVRAQNFKFSFDQNDDEEEEEEEEESLNGNVKKKRRRKWWSEKQPEAKIKSFGNVFDEAIESIWILKAFKSFGWFLPFIIISLLLATGPKAFLITLAFSLALSALSLAFEKLFRKTQRRPKRKARLRRKAASIYARNVEIEEGEEVPETRKSKMDNQSWVGGNNGPLKRANKGVPDFGGWDFVDETGFMQGKSRVTSESQRTQKGKLSRSGRENEAPLLLRLLMALFPFIGFWAKMFW